MSLDQEGYVHYNLRFLLEPSLGAVALQSSVHCVALHDLERLLDYLEEHIGQLITNPNTESPVFVEYELGFQVQAMSGGAADDGSDGDFTIRFLVNVGRTPDIGSDGEVGAKVNVYVGGESVITLSDVRSFATSMRAALSTMGY